jgi:hypothetical protein
MRVLAGCSPPAGKYYKDGHEYSYDYNTKSYTPYTDGYASYGTYHGSPVYPPPAPYGAPAPYGGYVSVLPEVPVPVPEVLC